MPAPPGTRRHTDRAAEDFGEMRLIVQATLERDLSKRFAGAKQQLLGPMTPPVSYIGHRRLTKRLTKGSAEVTRAEVQYGGQIVEADSCVEICADIGADPTSLPHSQPTGASG